MIIRSIDIIQMLDDEMLLSIPFKDLQSLCIMASIDSQIQLENESISNRRNLC